MSIIELNAKAEQLNDLENLLSKLKASRGVLDFKHHQKAVTVHIRDCINLTVSETDRGYMQRPKKGMDMIILGIKKLYNNQIDATNQKIIDCKAEINKIAISISNS